MTRWKLTLEYDGGGFLGWQRQSQGLSVQEVLETAIFGFAQESVTVHGAGRTDAGVHASGQVAHFDLVRPVAPARLCLALNAHLRPRPVAVLAAEAVDETFHARFSARRRAYLYRILNRPAPPTSTRGQVCFVPRSLDVAAMQAAAAPLLGRHDFTSFRAAECQAASPVKTLEVLRLERDGAEVRIVAEARSFLHRQVRNLVGSLIWVGEGRWRPERLAAVLAARDRRAAGPTAPPQGLCLTRVDY